MQTRSIFSGHSTRRNVGVAMGFLVVVAALVLIERQASRPERDPKERTSDDLHIPRNPPTARGVRPRGALSADRSQREAMPSSGYCILRLPAQMERTRSPLNSS